MRVAADATLRRPDATLGSTRAGGGRGAKGRGLSVSGAPGPVVSGQALIEGVVAGRRVVPLTPLIPW
jgi:hypothetical protein